MREPVSTIPLVELAAVTMGQSPPGISVTREERGLDFLQGSAEFGPRNPNPQFRCDPPLRVAKAGSTLISVRAPVGSTNRADRDYCIGRGLAAVLAKTGRAENVFLLHAIEQSLGYLHRRSQGSTFLAISGHDLRGVPIPAFPIEVQRRTCEIANAIDSAVEQTEALIAKTQQIKAGLMHDLFTRGVLPDGELRAVGTSQMTSFGPIPDAWALGSLLDVADASRQAILTGPFGADLGSDDFVTEGVPVLRIGNVQAGHMDLSDLLFVSRRKAETLRRYMVRAGDLLFARQGATTGRNALATSDVDGCLINYHIIRVALDPDRCDPLFIEAAFHEQVVKTQIERDKGRGTREGINTAQLKALRVPLADSAEQRRVGTALRAHAADIGMLSDDLAKLQALKKGLMHDLLTGTVRVRAANAETVAAGV